MTPTPARRHRARTLTRALFYGPMLAAPVAAFIHAALSIP